MNLSECGARFIAEFEGLYLHPYDDPVGYCTVGIGHLLKYARCDGTERSLANEAEAYDLLRTDMDGTYSKAVNDWANARGRLLRQHEFDALASFTLNLGVGIIGNPNSSLRAALDSHGDVAGALALYDKAGGHTLPGLTRRRAREGALFARGEYGFPCVPSLPTRHNDDDDADD